jgi:peptidoglycan/xylan/chitin deacetylase (PgdA/CDA1 family)
MRIAILISHGTNRGPYFTPKPRWRTFPPLDAARFDRYFGIAAELGCTSISYDDLEAWRDRDTPLPPRPVMFDFDHPNISIYREVWPLMRRLGFTGTLFINTSAMEKIGDRRYMTWNDVAELASAGWGIGSHMHNHMGLDYLARKDPTGALIRDQMERCDALLDRHLGIRSRDFAYTTTTWSRAAEEEVRRRYRFARLWTIDALVDTDEGKARFADLAGVAGDDEDDGGPPEAARYITKATHAYRLPAMDFEFLIYGYDAYRAYIERAEGIQAGSA